MPPTNVDAIDFDDIPELTDEMMARALPPTKFFGKPFGMDDDSDRPATRRARGRPKSETAKLPVKLRLDPEVVAGFRATGPGWQSRINAVLRAHLTSK